nr:hypothetical protein [Candidatus Sigynarchaeota archaeon]
MEAFKTNLKEYLDSARNLGIDEDGWFAVLQKRFDKIKAVVEGGQVFKYYFVPSGRILWIVQGKDDEYLLLPPRYCTCGEHHFNVTLKKQAACCYHAIARAICEQTECFKEIWKIDDVFHEYASDFLRELVE